jgi:hypothetical protein
MPVMRLDRVPLAGSVLEPTSLFGQVPTVLGVAGTFAGLDIGAWPAPNSGGVGTFGPAGGNRCRGMLHRAAMSEVGL